MNILPKTLEKQANYLPNLSKLGRFGRFVLFFAQDFVSKISMKWEYDKI